MFRSPCTICTDLLTCDNLAACPCGHVYHNNCLETWYQRSRTCPTCRKSCPTSIKLYFSDVQESASQEDVHTVKNELRKQTALSLEKDAQIKVLHEKVNEMSSRTEEQLCLVRKAQELAENEKLIQESLKKQVQFLTDKTKHIKMLEKKVVSLKTNVERLERFETMLLGTHDEAEDMLRNIGTGSKTVNELASQLIIMKRENGKMRDAKKKSSAEKAQLERDYNSLNHK
ncbi:E3 ubiquitin- ligase TRAIP, partial [Paramuricea clavata]